LCHYKQTSKDKQQSLKKVLNAEAFVWTKQEHC